MSEQQLRELAIYRRSDSFSPVERLVLDYAVAATKTPVEVPDSLFGDLRKHLDEPKLLELTAAIAWENFRARFAHALDVESEDLSEGAYCPLPERETTG